MSADPPKPPGFFGKVPARGDFLARRVPAGLAAAWEAWLASLTVTARDAGGEGWRETWLTAPLWHFALGPELVPDHGASGVLAASMDRVGRLFPFTILGAAWPAGAPTDAEWQAAAETQMLAALEDGFDPASLDRALVRLGPPPPVAVGDVPPGAWPLPPGIWPDALQVAPGQSAWWCRASDRVAPVLLRCHGFPGSRTSAAMILGGLPMSPAR